MPPPPFWIRGGYGCKEKNENEGEKRSFWRCSIFYHLPSCGFGDYINVCSYRRQSAHLQQQHQSRSTAFDLQQPNPLQSPRPFQQPPWVNERCNMFGRRSKKVKLSMWEHEFVCMASSGQATPPPPAPAPPPPPPPRPPPPHHLWKKLN